MLHGCLAVLLASSASCQITRETGEGRPATVTFAAAGGTKVAEESPSGEVAISSLVATAFRPDGGMDGQSHGTADAVTVECTTGERDFMVTANVDVSSAASRQEMERISVAIEDVSPSGLPMSQSLHRKVESVNPTVRVMLERHVSKSCIMSVTLDMASDHLASLPFRLVSAYNTNVAADTRLDGTFPTGRYVNRLGWQGEASSLTRDDISLDMANGQKHLTPHSLYLLPNPQEEDSFVRDSWSPRHTRTVIEGTLAGTTYYYPVTLPVTGRNVSYRFENVLIARAGSLHPEDPLSYLSVVFSEPSVGDFGEADGGALPFRNKACAIAFAPDGADPFELFDDLLGVSSRPGVIYMGDGTLSPFNDITESLTADSVRGLIIFRDGTVMPFDEFPSEIDFGHIAKVIVFDDALLEQYLKDTSALVVETAGGLIVFSNGSLMSFGEFPDDIDLGGVSRIVFFTEAALESFLKEAMGLDFTSASGVIVYTDGTVLPFSGMPSEALLNGAARVIFFNESDLQEFAGINSTVESVYSSGVLVMSDGSVLMFENVTEGFSLGSVAKFIIPDVMTLSGFISGLTNAELGTAAGVMLMEDGTFIPFNQFPTDVDLTHASSVLTCDPDAVVPFITNTGNIPIVSSCGFVVLGAGALEAFPQTVEDLVLGNRHPVLVFGDSASLESFRDAYGDVLLGSGLPLFVCGSGHSLNGWDMADDTSLVLMPSALSVD